MVFRILHRLFGGGGVSVSESMEFLGDCSDDAGGTTRSKETKSSDGDSGLSHRMMIIRRPGAGVQGADDKGAESSASAFAWNDK